MNDKISTEATKSNRGAFMKELGHFSLGCTAPNSNLIKTGYDETASRNW